MLKIIFLSQILIITTDPGGLVIIVTLKTKHENTQTVQQQQQKILSLFQTRPKLGGSDPTPRILTSIKYQFYLIIGSKNVHLIIGKPGDLESYTESRFHVSP